ncbi:hypothetical protein [Acetobacter nitrogenifigens]|uniref:hypothetical protein n=1 Tax=Acetobacter nitrogenifigens TaxID=285268 RepID=UPI001FEFDB52|nr:hypothetical protein [Acetobacter nitrogenifigens]
MCSDVAIITLRAQQVHADQDRGSADAHADIGLYGAAAGAPKQVATFWTLPFCHAVESGTSCADGERKRAPRP